jgi:hypothetical protein
VICVQEQSPTATTARWAGLAAIGFAVLLFVGFVIGMTPNYNKSDQEWVAWFHDSGHRGAQIAGMFLMAAAALLLVVFFVTVLRRAVAAGGSATASALASVAGTMLATTIGVAAVIRSGVSAAVQFAPNHFPVPGADVLRTLDNLAFGLLAVAGGFAAALFVASFSHALRGTAILPGWLVTAGYIIGALLLFSFLFFPLLLLPLWALIAGVIVAAKAGVAREIEPPLGKGSA